MTNNNARSDPPPADPNRQKEQAAQSQRSQALKAPLASPVHDQSALSPRTHLGKVLADGLPYLTTKDAATFLQYKDRTLEEWRQKGRGPRWFKRGGKVLYRRVDLEAWAEGRPYAPIEG